MEPLSNPAQPSPPTVLSGSCNCGKVRYTSSIPPSSISLCHCQNCRKSSGAPFIAFGGFQNIALRWHGPDSQTEPAIKTTSSATAFRGFCGDCGSTLFMYHCRPDGPSVAMGTVDDGTVVGSMVKPKEHIFLKEKAAWWSVSDDDGMARHGGFDKPFQTRLKEWAAKGSPQRADLDGG